MLDQELVNIRDLEVGFVFHCFNLVPYLTDMQSILVSTFTSLKICTDPKKCPGKTYGIVKLRESPHHRSRELSEGQSERISIGHALISDLSILLEDEPIGNLDSKKGNMIFRILSHSNTESRQLVIIANYPEIAKCIGSFFQKKDGITQYN
jgi:ABC-type antimicrobial peptide transport system, ATPase component